MSSRSRVSAIEQEGCFEGGGGGGGEVRRESSLLADYRVVSGFFSSFFFPRGEPKMGNDNLGILDSSFNNLREY